jgi:ABC-2 type transport system permease protein
MNTVRTLLAPRFWPIGREGILNSRSGSRFKRLFLGLLGLVFWLGVFAISWRVLIYFKGIEEIGDILGFKLLSMLLIVSFALLLFSGILASLSKLYLSRDLPLVHAMPVPAYKIFFSRWIDSTIDSSWMVAIFTVPVFLAYGIVYQAGLFYYVTILQSLFALIIIASTVSTMGVVIGVMLIPASRMKSVFILLGVMSFVGIYLAIRLLRPEQLVDPEIFDTVMVYVASLESPSAPVLPSTWVYDAIRAALTGTPLESCFHSTIAWSFAATCLFTALILADRFYFRGYSKAQTAPPRLLKKSGFGESVFAFLPGRLKAYTTKEIKTFLRDQTQWSQLFLIAALVVIYIYNFSVLPLDKSPIRTIYLQNLFAFLNMGLALFVLTAVSARFAYPAVSQEKNAFWVVKVSPIGLNTFLWIKFWVYYPPLLILTEILIVATNLLLQVTPFMMGLSTITVFLLVPGIVSMGIGLGAAFPDFKAENPAQTVTSFGGLVFMILCALLIALVVVVEAGPVYRLFMASLHELPLSTVEWSWIVVSFAAVFAIGLAAIFLPMRYGAKQLERITS